MARNVKCPQCGHAIAVGDDAAGQHVTCAACKKTFAVQAAPATAVGKASPDTARMAKSPAATPAKASPDTGRMAKSPAPQAAAKTPAAPPTAPSPAAAPPPVGSAARPWHLHVDGRTVGPYAAAAVVDQVKSGKLPTETLAWKEGMADWQPLSEIPDFQVSLAAAIHRQKTAAAHGHSHDHGHGPDREDDRDERRHYAPGRSARKEQMIALYALGGIVAVGLIVVLVIMGRSKNDPGPRTPQPLTPFGGSQQVVYNQPIVQTLTPAEKKAAAGPTHPTVDNKAYFDKFKIDLAKKFEEAIAANKQAKSGPIHALARACKKAADDLSKRSWAPQTLKAAVDSLVDQLRQAGDRITEELKEKDFKWQAADRIEGKARSTILEVDNITWLEAPQKLLLNDFAKRVEDAGL